MTSPILADCYSLTNLAAGVYSLDVIAQKGNTKALYHYISFVLIHYARITL
jgi:hypothetical protein